MNWRGAQALQLFFHYINHSGTPAMVNHVVMVIIYKNNNTKLLIVDSPHLQSVSWNSSTWPAACRWGPAGGPGSSCLPRTVQTAQGALTLLSVCIVFHILQPSMLCANPLVAYLVGELFDSPLMLAYSLLILLALLLLRFQFILQFFDLPARSENDQSTHYNWDKTNKTPYPFLGLSYISI